MVSKYFFAVYTFIQFINCFSFMDQALVSWLKNRMNGENSIDIYTLLLLLLLLSRKNTGVGCHFLLQCMKVKMKVKLLSRDQLPYVK